MPAPAPDTRRRGRMTLAAAAIALGTAPAAATDVPADDEVAARVDEYLKRLEPLGLGAAVLIARDGKVLLSGGYGLADRDRGIPVTADTVFTIGSITKQFTAAAILKLQEQGKLSVEDPISRYLGPVPPDKAGVTIHHLLTHSAGLPPALGGDFDTEATRSWIVEEALAAPLLFEPGGGYEYSNVGYSLLGVIIEKVSGRSYDAFLSRHLFEPAGMNRTGYALADREGLTVAEGYRGGEHWGTVLERPWLDDGPCWNLRANGGIHSTVGDLYRWHLALRGDAILSEASRRAMFAPHVDEGGGQSFYGYGWAIFTTLRGTKLVAHNGGNMVFFADFRRYVDEDTVIIFASNTADLGAGRLSSALPRIVFGHDYDPPPRFAEVSVDRLASLAGAYRLEPEGVVHVEADDRGLRLRGDTAGARVLLGMLPADDADAARLTTVVEDAVGASLRGDYEPLHAALGGGIPLEEIRRLETDMRRQREARYGPLEGFEVVGVVPLRPDVYGVLVRFDHARGDVPIEFVFRAQRLVDVRRARRGGAVDLLPVSQHEFVAYEVGRPVRLRVRFEPDALAVIAGDDEHRARRLAR